MVNPGKYVRMLEEGDTERVVITDEDVGNTFILQHHMNLRTGITRYLNGVVGMVQEGI